MPAEVLNLPYIQKPTNQNKYRVNHQLGDMPGVNYFQFVAHDVGVGKQILVSNYILFLLFTNEILQL